MKIPKILSQLPYADSSSALTSPDACGFQPLIRFEAPPRSSPPTPSDTSRSHPLLYRHINPGSKVTAKMSKSSKRTFVPNSTRAIIDTIVRKRSRVEGNQPTIEADLQSTPKTPRMLVRKSLRVQADRPVIETVLQPTPIIPSQLDSTRRKEGIGSDLTTIPQRPTIGESTNESPVQLQSTSPELPKKKTRGKNRGLNADKVHEMLGRKIPITVKEAIGRPTCQYAEMFASEIGFVVRNYAPMNVEQWKNVTSQDLSKLVKRLSMIDQV